ncbi:DUF5683 domain-containing protein [Methanolapillus ohkumae]
MSEEINSIAVQTEQKGPEIPQNKFLALVFSFIWPGLGQVYNGQLWKGVAIYIGYIIGLLLFFIPGVVVWVYAMHDAFYGAEKINKREIPYIEPKFTGTALFLFVPIVIFVILYFLFVMVFMASMAAFM